MPPVPAGPPRSPLPPAQMCPKRLAAAAVPAALAAVSIALLYLGLELRSVEAEVSSLREQVAHTVNTTIVYLNTTVVEAKQAVEDVNAEVGRQGTFMAAQGAGTFAVLSALFFAWHASAHLRDMKEPAVQRKILAILWMVPVYSVTSWLILVLGGTAEWYLAVVKDFYEAYCIYTFLSFLIAVLGRNGGRSAVVDLLVRRDPEHLRPPLDCCGLCFGEGRYAGNPRARADAVLYQCQVCAMQFVFLRPVTSVGMALSNQFYGTDWGWASPQFVFVAVQNVTFFVAFSGLVKFYHATRDDLAWCKPFPKFLCIKGVVFMTFWQGMAITVLAEAVYQVDDPMEWSRRAQNFLICVEMLFFAIAHIFVFPTEEWEPGYRPRERGGGTALKFGDNIAIHDFARDVKFIIKSRKGHRTKQRGESSYAGVSAAADATVEWEDDKFEEEDREGSDDEDEDRYIIVLDRRGGAGDEDSAVVLGTGEERTIPLDLNQLEGCEKEAGAKASAEIV